MARCKQFKVLSIDFDYFVDAFQSEKWEFPDPNENLSIELNSSLWVTHYAQQQFNIKRFGKENDRLLESIPVNKDAFAQVMKYLKTFKKNKAVTQVVVTNSHAAIFPYLKQKVSKGIPVKICNLDDHSDFYGIGSDLNCGNWGNLLYNNVEERGLLNESELSWVCQDDSISHSEENLLYEGYSEFLSVCHVSPDKLIEHLNLFFEKEAPDMIFLCRSSCWVPPHLDFKFLEMTEVLRQYDSQNIVMDRKVMVPRYTSKFKKSVKQYYDCISMLGI